MLMAVDRTIQSGKCDDPLFHPRHAAELGAFAFKTTSSHINLAIEVNGGKDRTCAALLLLLQNSSV